MPLQPTDSSLGLAATRTGNPPEQMHRHGLPSARQSVPAIARAGLTDCANKRSGLRNGTRQSSASAGVIPQRTTTVGLHAVIAK